MSVKNCLRLCLLRGDGHGEPRDSLPKWCQAHTAAVLQVRSVPIRKDDEVQVVRGSFRVRPLLSVIVCARKCSAVAMCCAVAARCCSVLLHPGEAQCCCH